MTKAGTPSSISTPRVPSPDAEGPRALPSDTMMFSMLGVAPPDADLKDLKFSEPAVGIPPSPVESPSDSVEVASTAPQTLLMEYLGHSEAGVGIEAAPTSPVAILSRAIEAKSGSQIHWDAALEAFGELPQEDKMAAGKSAFYTQAASIPEIAQRVPVGELRPSVVLEQAKADGTLGSMLEGIDINETVKLWSAENPEQANMSMLTGFADYAGDELVKIATQQRVGSFDQIRAEKGSREEALFNLMRHGDGYVRDRGAFLTGANELWNSGSKELAQQILADD